MDEAHTERKRFDRGLLRITPGGGLIQRGKEGFGLAPQPPIGSCALWPPGIRSRGAALMVMPSGENGLAVADRGMQRSFGNC